MQTTEFVRRCRPLRSSDVAGTVGLVGLLFRTDVLASWVGAKSREWYSKRIHAVEREVTRERGEDEKS